MLYISFLSLLVIISMSSYVHGPQGFLACELPGYTLCYFSNGFPMCFFVPRLLLYWVSSTHPSTSSGLEDRARCMAASNGPCHLVSSTSRTMTPPALSCGLAASCNHKSQQTDGFTAPVRRPCPRSFLSPWIPRGANSPRHKDTWVPVLFLVASLILLTLS